MRAPVLATRHRVVPPEDIRATAGVLSVMSGQTRSGDWEVPCHLRIACVMGSAELDLREARLSAGETRIEIIAVMGSVELVLPPGVHVVTDGSALAGEWAVHTDPTVLPMPGAPVIRLEGTAYFSSVEVHVRFPGERPRDARKRIKSA